MKTRAQLDAELDRLAGMLPLWLEKVRHHAQFWPQFNALSQDILDGAGADDHAHVLQRLDAMLAEHEVNLDPCHPESEPRSGSASIGPDTEPNTGQP